jgi:hypothetical protein
MMTPTYIVCDYDPECHFDSVVDAVQDALEYANEEDRPILVVKIVAVIQPTKS